MRKVIGIGETVLDIIFKNNQPDKNGVSTEYVNVLPVKQPVSMAFLNEKNDAEYSFYRDALDIHPEFKLPQIQTGDVVLFGSFFALNPAVRPQVRAFLEYAKAAGAILYYDVNFRPSHRKDLGNVLGNIEENYDYADVVRGSDQDFITLYGIDDPDKVYSEKILPHCRNFIYTKSVEPIEVRSLLATAAPEAGNIFKKSYPVAPVETVSTIGAGDSFNAGFIYGLSKLAPEPYLRLAETQWDSLIAIAQAFSANCCTSMYNYVTKDFAKSLK